VYRARHTKLGKEVALKTLPAELAQSEQYVARFQREARLAAKLDQASFYTNSAVSGFLERSKLPLVCPTDKEAIDLALRLLAPVVPAQARVVRIRDTLHLAQLWISDAMLDEVRDNPAITLGDHPQPLAFDQAGVLV